MNGFMDENFLLNTPLARELYHHAAEGCPIIDYHCHISPKAIYEDYHYENITQLWLGSDHYKWRLMRAAGVEEQYITGDAPDKEKFLAWAKVLGRAVGNPLYHWSHLELKRFFAYDGLLNEKTAEAVWALTCERLKQPSFSARGLIARSNVEIICTTDDPIDTLEWHERLAADDTFPTTVLPAWRPDRAINLEKPDYCRYLDKLSDISGIRVHSFSALKEALKARMDDFEHHGCRLSDHGLNYVPYAPTDDAEIEAIFHARLAGLIPNDATQEKFKTSCMLFLAKEYARRGWVMQLHYGCRRNINPKMYALLGPDAGFDTIDNHTPLVQTSAFLAMLEYERSLPKTILYNLNPSDNAVIDALCGCFQNEEAVCKLQHGSAWWFNDHLRGMTEQLTGYAESGYLAGFVGMLTDSRSFLSYPRHEYFRRILCRLLGQWVEDGLFPQDLDTLSAIVRDISHDNAKRYFNFPTKQENR